LATIAEDIGSRLDSNGSDFLAQQCYEHAIHCYELLKNIDESKRIKRKKGDSYVRLANANLANANQGYMVASHHLAMGIECLRQGGEEKDKIQSLHKTLREWQKKSVQEMQSFSHETDISELIERAKQHVRGKSLKDAVFAMTVGHPTTNCSELRQRVIKNAERFPLSHLITGSLVAPDGRTIAHKPSALSTDEDERERGIQAEMFQQAIQIDWSLRAQAYIDACRQEIWMEHRPSYKDLAFLVLQNPFIPRGYEMLFLKGIVAGFRGDFDVAVHLLVPQIEECIRHVLTSAGHITSKLDAKLIQEQRSLGTLLEMPETIELFGESNVFELRGLLCEKFGSELRNQLAHGFLTYNGCWSSEVINFWWLVLRLLCVPIVRQKIANEAKE
jgi:hypothetical protein